MNVTIQIFKIDVAHGFVRAATQKKVFDNLSKDQRYSNTVASSPIFFIVLEDVRKAAKEAN